MKTILTLSLFLISSLSYCAVGDKLPMSALDDNSTLRIKVNLTLPGKGKKLYVSGGKFLSKKMAKAKKVHCTLETRDTFAPSKLHEPLKLKANQIQLVYSAEHSRIELEEMRIECVNMSSGHFRFPQTVRLGDLKAALKGIAEFENEDLNLYRSLSQN